MAIAHQPVMTPDPVRSRPIRLRRAGTLPDDRPSRAWTATRIFGLLLATASCVALATAVVAGTALFALLNAAG